MNLLRCILLLPLTTALAPDWSAPQSRPVSLPQQPEALVRSLYREVVVRAPSGLPSGADRKIFAPDLSKALLHGIDLADACSRDWVRQNQGHIIKAPFGWTESGIFSGGDEKASPGDFQIDVRLTFRPSHGPGSWRVAPIVVQENGHFAVDDVIYLKDEGRVGDVDGRLSEALSQGCDGPRWVGYRYQ